MAYRADIGGIRPLTSRIGMCEGSIRECCIHGVVVIKTHCPDAQRTAAHQRAIGLGIDVVRTRIRCHLHVHRRVNLNPAIHGHARCIAHIEWGA